MLAISTRSETLNQGSTNALRRVSSFAYLSDRQNPFCGKQFHMLAKTLPSKILHRVNFSLGIDFSYASTKRRYETSVDIRACIRTSTVAHKRLIFSKTFEYRYWDWTLDADGSNQYVPLIFLNIYKIDAYSLCLAA